MDGFESSCVSNGLSRFSLKKKNIRKACISFATFVFLSVHLSASNSAKLRNRLEINLGILSKYFGFDFFTFYVYIFSILTHFDFVHFIIYISDLFADFDFVHFCVNHSNPLADFGFVKLYIYMF
jgi:hypothetical protein